MQKTQFTAQQKALTTKQPRSGILPVRLFEVIELKNDEHDIKKGTECANPEVIQATIVHLMQYVLTGNKDDSFILSLRGSRNVNEELIAKSMIKSINNDQEDKLLSEKTITTALQLSGYDNAFRNGPSAFKIPVQLIIPDEETFCNVKIMLERCLNFNEAFGPIKQFLVEFPGGYTSSIINGDADFMTEDTLYMINVDKKGPNKVDTLNLLICYLLSMQSKRKDEFEKIKNIGFLSPRLNCVYKIAIEDIDEEIINTVKKIIN